MTPLKEALKYLEHFSITTIGENKRANFPWREQQTNKISQEKFEKNYSYKGGIIKKDGNEIASTTNFALICGYDNLEVMDVDLKTLDTAREKESFWNKYYAELKKKIYDFDNRFSIYRTKNQGFHILYKTKLVEGNQKIAVQEGKTEALLETRGVGGYVAVYPDNCYNKTTYFDIDYIDDEDRDILMTVSRSYNRQSNNKQVIKKHVEKNVVETGKDENFIESWKDFDKKANMLDLIQDEFDVVNSMETSSAYVILRKGNPSSSTSGYVYKDSNCMYLFTTGTRYAAEQILTPSAVYAFKYHNGDFKASGKDLYNKGYGTRKIEPVKEVSVYNYEDELKALNFPIDIFPIEIQKYMIQAKITGNLSPDYMACSLLWVISVCIGKSIKLKVKNGWYENSIIWVATVGQAGWGKSPATKQIISPLKKINRRNVIEYNKRLDAYDEYMALSPKEKKDVEEVRKPKTQQLIVNDFTLESLVGIHHDSDNCVGLYKDELKGWFNDMNKYREGSDMESWLEFWNGGDVIVNRLSRRDLYLDSSSIPVLGSIQPAILTKYAVGDNRDNGFMDRLLICYPDLKSEKDTRRDMDGELIDWYNNSIEYLYNIIQDSVIERDPITGDIKPRIASMSKEAQEFYYDSMDKIVDIENDDETHKYIKQMMPKQKSYIARFALLIHVFNDLFSEEEGDALTISKDSVEKAVRLSNYFVNTAQRLFVQGKKEEKVDDVFKSKKDPKEKAFEVFASGLKISVADLCMKLDVSRKTIYNWKAEFKGKNKKSV